MGPYDDITFFTKYQTFLVGLLGFLGVMATLWWNARQARAAREETVRHERATLRTAMIEELRLVKGAFELRIEQTARDSRADFSYVPKRLPILIYDRLLDRIGILSSSEVAAIMHAYGIVQQLPDRLRLISKTPEDNPDFFEVESEQFEMLRGIHERYLQVVDEAIRKLEAAG